MTNIKHIDSELSIPIKSPTLEVGSNSKESQTEKNNNSGVRV